MHENIYNSTSGFGNKKLEHILNTCTENGLVNLELGSNIAYSEDNIDLLFRFKDTSVKFLIHNYFPPPRQNFVLNLASNDKEIRSQSMAHCREAIDLCFQLQIPFYSVHAGFAFHAASQHLGKAHLQINLPRIPYKKAYSNFVESIAELADYASLRGIKLAVENNVVTVFNLEDGANNVLLLADAKEARIFYKDVSSKNLFYLIDLGHLKISSFSLGFGRYDYLEEVIPYTIAFHVNDNNSEIDQHEGFDESVWFRDIVANNPDKTFIIEVSDVEIAEISYCYRVLERMLS